MGGMTARMNVFWDDGASSHAGHGGDPRDLIVWVVIVGERTKFIINQNVFPEGNHEFHSGLGVLFG